MAEAQRSDALRCRASWAAYRNDGGEVGLRGRLPDFTLPKKTAKRSEANPAR